MVFSSHVFLFWFLPLALVAYHLSPRRAQHLLLTLLSFLFYGWANPIFLLVMLASIGIDFGLGLWIGDGPFRNPGAPRTRREKTAVTVSVVVNLALLGFFKYFGMATESWDALMSLLGADPLRLESTLKVVLPLGISFYTFQSLSYTIDVYRGQVRPMRNVIDYACFVSLFPQLVAGPIVRFSELESQLASRTMTLEKLARGAAMFALGLGKKILLANPCGKLSDAAFEAGSRHALDAWLGSLAFGYQMYFDFSGYSDMAVGLGLMLGFVFPKNFDSPVLAVSIGDYWRRWHISLSTWLRDYLYLPLGGSRVSPLRGHVNLWIVMLLAGLWHGASWTFVLWGALHGVMLSLERLNGRRPIWWFLPTPMQIFWTFAFSVFVRVAFRSRDLPTTFDYWRDMFGFGSGGPQADVLAGAMRQPFGLAMIALCTFFCFVAPQGWNFCLKLTPLRTAAVGAVFAGAVLLLTTQSYNPFIYFIF